MSRKEGDRLNGGPSREESKSLIVYFVKFGESTARGWGWEFGWVMAFGRWSELRRVRRVQVVSRARWEFTIVRSMDEGLSLVGRRVGRSWLMRMTGLKLTTSIYDMLPTDRHPEVQSCGESGGVMGVEIFHDDCAGGVVLMVEEV